MNTKEGIANVTAGEGGFGDDPAFPAYANSPAGQGDESSFAGIGVPAINAGGVDQAADVAGASIPPVLPDVAQDYAKPA